MYQKGLTRGERQPFFLPYVPTALEVLLSVVSWQSAAICPLVEVLRTQITLSRACGTFSVTRQDRVLIIICADATPLSQTSATKCDVGVPIWFQGVAAAGDVSWRLYYILYPIGLTVFESSFSFVTQLRRID